MWRASYSLYVRIVYMLRTGGAKAQRKQGIQKASTQLASGPRPHLYAPSATFH